MRYLLAILLFCGFGVFADDNVFPGGDFESPVVQGRTPADRGGDPSEGKNPAWVEFKFAPATTGTNGSITGGLTDQIAHGRRQSLYIDFDHVKTPYQSATLVSNFVPVVSGSNYQVGIWGRMDAKDLIDKNGRPGYLKVEVDFFAADANESVGDPFYAVLPLAAGPDREAFFKPDTWNDFTSNLTAPAGAVFAQITWRWESVGNGDSGEINGTVYFDDATLRGAANANPNLTPAPVAEPTPDTTGTGSAGAEVTGTGQ